MLYYLCFFCLGVLEILWVLFVFFCLCAFVQIVVYVVGKFVVKWERPYQHDSTASRLLSEVKHARAQLVLRWGTTLES